MGTWASEPRGRLEMQVRLGRWSFADPTLHWLRLRMLTPLPHTAHLELKKMYLRCTQTQNRAHTLWNFPHPPLHHFANTLEVAVEPSSAQPSHLIPPHPIPTQHMIPSILVHTHHNPLPHHPFSRFPYPSHSSQPLVAQHATPAR
ncbi:hypothetical protein K458DRAFT_159739 [Lentithecium fluviatile CBS 122367]|uniref:Uncharacterized protein n=1 Tax=Lentithecium fluviatile CBS 122367 TaxID=1168545 RepID=A0A6G1IHA8_9PLEO|nr:hypothetical protein K458DRAFT_159739 [Lentithecium fluviatile CBS 122367]